MSICSIELTFAVALDVAWGTNPSSGEKGDVSGDDCVQSIFLFLIWKQVEVNNNTYIWVRMIYFDLANFKCYH